MQSYIKFISILMILYSSVLSGKNRARDLGIPFSGVPGTNNAITDVAGVTVGHSTIIQGSGKKILGKGPIRTGVTAVLPRGKNSLQDPVFAGWYSLNGNGEMTGTSVATTTIIEPSPSLNSLSEFLSRLRSVISFPTGTPAMVRSFRAP